MVTAFPDSVYVYSFNSSVLHIKSNEIQSIDEIEDENKW